MTTVGSSKPYIFLSWAGDHAKQLAKRVRALLQQRMPVFFSEEVRTGDKWRSTILQECRKCTHCVVILTPGNLGASWMLFEQGAFFAQEKELLVYIFSPAGHAELPEPLGDLQARVVDSPEDVAKDVIQSVNERPLDSSPPVVDFRRDYVRAYHTFECAALADCQAHRSSLYVGPWQVTVEWSRAHTEYLFGVSYTSGYVDERASTTGEVLFHPTPGEVSKRSCTGMLTTSFLRQPHARLFLQGNNCVQLDQLGRPVVLDLGGAIRQLVSHSQGAEYGDWQRYQVVLGDVTANDADLCMSGQILDGKKNDVGTVRLEAMLPRPIRLHARRHAEVPRRFSAHGIGCPLSTGTAHGETRRIDSELVPGKLVPLRSYSTWTIEADKAPESSQSTTLRIAISASGGVNGKHKKPEYLIEAYDRALVAWLIRNNATVEITPGEIRVVARHPQERGQP